MATTRELLKERGPFDASDPFDAAADMFRRQVADMVLAATDQPPMNRLPGHRQIEAIIGGVMVGMIGACFAHVEPAGYPAVMKAIKQYLPQAKATVLEIMANGPKAHG